MKKVEIEEIWSNIWGTELYQDISSGNREVLEPIKWSLTEPYESFKSFWKQSENWCDLYANIQIDTETKLFDTICLQLLSAYLQWKTLDWQQFSLIENAVDVIPTLLYARIKDIPARTCILEMQRMKKAGKLEGNDIKEEYEFFRDKVLGNFEYTRALCDKYPEMLRLVFSSLELTYDYLMEFINNLRKDQSWLEQVLCQGREIGCVHHLNIGSSDKHSGGKTVIQCETKYGTKLIYKPRSMKKELVYQRLFAEFSQSMDLDSMEYNVYDGGDYGWAEYLEHLPCQTLEQVQNYYRRMGIHVFLVMLLNGGDMHHDNILAVGEYPIIIDMETLPGIRKKKDIQTAEDQVDKLIMDSVLLPGILPTPSWKADDRSLVLSALYQNEEIRSTVKLPVISQLGTSEMHIEHQYVEMKRGNSLPVYEGKKQFPAEYVTYLCEGFEKAYKYWLSHKTHMEDLMKEFWDCKTRILLRHTQQYNMYLLTSLHPAFLTSTKNRIYMLQVLQREDVDTKFVKKEIQDMFQLDIPLFECGGNEFVPAYQTSAYECYMERAEKCGEEDLNNQLALMHLSIEMACPEKLNNDYFATCKAEPQKKTKNYRMAIDKVIKLVEKSAVIKADDISWATLWREGISFWKLQPVDLSVYNGIGGIAIFYAYMKKLGFAVNKTHFELAINKLFRHTDSEPGESASLTGLLVGEGSTAYTYLLLYQLTDEKRFAVYAKKQASKLENIYQSDEFFDLLGGNAGAVILLVKMFETFHEEKWLQLAATIGDHLWEKRDKQVVGCGWNDADVNCALSGMAHGISGYLMAYAALLEHTKDRKYVDIINSLLLYENSLFSEEKVNWRDLRYPDQEAYSNAWCHGAAGILLARMKLISLPHYADNDEIKRDIERAAAILFTTSRRNGLCICHGMAGNYWIMREYARKYTLTEAQRNYMQDIRDEIISQVEQWDHILPQDRHTPGLMTGMAGVGCILGEIYKDIHK